MPATRDKASNLLFWAGSLTIDSTPTPAEVEVWADRGIKGWALDTGWLYEMGSSSLRDFSVGGAGRNSLITSDIADRLTTGFGAGSRVFLGHWLPTYWDIANRAQGPGDWFRDADEPGLRGWTFYADRVEDLASAAAATGFSGVSIDAEDYIGNLGTATWHWQDAYSLAAGRTKQQVKDKAFERGAQYMAAVLAGYPNAHVLFYSSSYRFSNFDFAGLIQKFNYGQSAGNYDDYVVLDFLAGMLSTEGYASVQYLDGDFYKVAHLPSTTFLEGEKWAVNSFFADLSSRCTNWVHASQRVHWTPFTFTDEDPNPFYAARTAAHVAGQFSVARDIATDEWQANYAYANCWPADSGFDYTAFVVDGVPQNYVPGFQSAATPGAVTDPAPTITVTSGNLAVGGTISGQATAHLGVRRVWWTHGATTTPIPHSFSPLTPYTKATAATYGAGGSQWSLAGLTWRAEWTAAGVPAGAQVHVEDIHGNTDTEGVLGGSPPPVETVVAGRGAGARIVVPSGRR